MNRKYIVCLLAFFFVFCLITFGSERKKPLPMKDLQNIGCDSYVPIPYPSNSNEIVIDLVFFINKFLSPNKNSNSNKLDVDVILSEYLYDTGVSIGEIVKVYNNIESLERDYSFLIRLKNKNNRDVASICMDSNGLIRGIGSVGLSGGSSNQLSTDALPFRSILSKPRVLDSLQKASGLFFSETSISNMRLFEGTCSAGDLFSPAWVINYDDGRTFYINSRSLKVYLEIDCLDMMSDSYNSSLYSYLHESNDSVEIFNQSYLGKKAILKEVGEKQ